MPRLRALSAGHLGALGSIGLFPARPCLAIGEDLSEPDHVEQVGQGEPLSVLCRQLSTQCVDNLPAVGSPPPHLDLPGDSLQALESIKSRVEEARLRVILCANSAMVLLYWDVGRLILERQQAAGWGARAIDGLSDDLRKAYPDMKGLSPRNLKYMRAFAESRPDLEIVKQRVSQLPRGYFIPSSLT